MNFNQNDKVLIINTEDIWENKEGIILSGADEEIIDDETEEYLVKIIFNENNVIQVVSKENLKLAEENSKYITESKKPDTQDFIYDYVYLTDIEDKEIHSWFFIDKISTAENISRAEIIRVARELKYNLFMVIENQFKKIIVAAPKCNIDSIYEDYADHLLGTAKVIDITNKGEK